MDKYKLLKKGILLDLIGMATMLIPFWGTIVDLIWAPYAAFQINKMYRGTQGKIAASSHFKNLKNDINNGWWLYKM